MKKKMLRYSLQCVFAVAVLGSSSASAKSEQVVKSLTIVGGGIIGAFEAYTAYQDAAAKGERLKITIYEKNADITQTTSTNIEPSLTPDEIVSVVPRGQDLVKKLEIPFDQPGGIKVAGIRGVTGVAADRFVAAAVQYGQDESAEQQRKAVLLALGKRSMALWESLYDQGDADLRRILDASNFHACREPRDARTKLHDGYRIDPIYRVANAQDVAAAMQQEYLNLGYTHTRTLTPDEVTTIDPYLSFFVSEHSAVDKLGARLWNKDAAAVFRPGGCLSTEVFLPKFYRYLEEKMGAETDSGGIEHANFQIRFGQRVTGVILDRPHGGHSHIVGLQVTDESMHTRALREPDSEYVFSPGEAVGTMARLGFQEPPSAGFAGAALRLTVPLSPEDLAKFRDLNHCMEVRQEGVVLAWQVRRIKESIMIGVGGTKAFYGTATPSKDEAFAKDRNLLQLNMMNDMLPQLMSVALQRPTQGESLTNDDLQLLENRQLVRRWVGTRAVAFDGFPTLGTLYTQDGLMVDNARVTTGLGSGGVSFAPAAVQVSRSIFHPELSDELTERVLQLGRSDRL